MPKSTRNRSRSTHLYPPRQESIMFRLSPGLGAALVLVTLSSFASAQWKGKEESREGQLHVLNPAAPMQAPQTLQLEEEWRIGGDQTDDIFGVITSIIEAEDGNLYMLDAQLTEIKVYSPEGEYLRTIGRAGEGPGEFRFAFSHFQVPGGDIGVLQAFPAKIVLLTLEGDPAGEYPLPEFKGQGFQIVIGAAHAGSQLAVMQMHNQQLDGGQGFVMKEVLTLSPPNSTASVELTSFTSNLSFTDPVIDEVQWTGMRNGRWAALSTGQVVAARKFAEYEFEVYGKDGKLERIVHREYPEHRRSDADKKFVLKLFEDSTRQQIPFPNKRFVISEVHNAISQLESREDGSIWVTSSRGRFERPKGTIGTFDVFDAKGRFVQQLSLAGDADPWRDLVTLVGDRVFVITDWLPSLVALQGGGGEEEEAAEEEDVEPMQVICYRLNAPKL
jgi:hypothetical protein